MKTKAIDEERGKYERKERVNIYVPGTSAVQKTQPGVN